jgi:hypothetical protein
MRSQWDCLLQNLGEWQGSFTRFSPQGEQLEDTPTVVSFEGLNNNQTIRQIVRRLPPNQPVDEKVLEYSSLGRNTLLLKMALSPKAQYSGHRFPNLGQSWV